MLLVDLSMSDCLVKQHSGVKIRRRGRGCAQQSHIQMNVEPCQPHAMYRLALSKGGPGHRRRQRRLVLNRCQLLLPSLRLYNKRSIRSRSMRPQLKHLKPPEYILTAFLIMKNDHQDRFQERHQEAHLITTMTMMNNVLIMTETNSELSSILAGS